MKQNVTPTHERIISLLNSAGFTNFRGGIQLFANQYDKDYGISVNYNGTGLHISKELVNEQELIDDEMIQVCRSWLFKE